MSQVRRWKLIMAKKLLAEVSSKPILFLKIPNCFSNTGKGRDTCWHTCFLEEFEKYNTRELAKNPQKMDMLEIPQR